MTVSSSQFPECIEYPTENNFCEGIQCKPLHLETDYDQNPSKNSEGLSPKTSPRFFVCPPYMASTSIFDSPSHDNCTQTILHADPSGAMTEKTLTKSYITGHFFRAYHAKHLHRRQKQCRRKTQAQASRNVTVSHQLQVLPHFKMQNEDEIDFNSKPPPNTKDNCDVASAVKHNMSNSRQNSANSLYQHLDFVNKSRLSLISSLAGSEKNLSVQLSYYSRKSVSEEEYENPDFPFSSKGDNGAAVGGDDIRNVTVPISLSIMIMTTYILIGAIVFCIWEDQNYLKWSYFCFVTLSTIGFGDIVPG